MNQQLRNMLIVIAVLVGLYYFISPYQQCMRNDVEGGIEGHEKTFCSQRTDW